MAYVELPAALAAKIVSRRIITDFPAQRNRSLWSGTSKILLLPGVEVWRGAITFQPLATESEIREARAFFYALRGIANTFELPFLPSRQAAAGTATTVASGGAQGSTSMEVADASAIVPGMPLTVALPSFHRRLMIVTAVYGDTIEFSPAMPESAAVGAAVEIAEPVCHVRLSDPSFVYDDASGLAGFSVEVEEALSESAVSDSDATAFATANGVGFDGARRLSNLVETVKRYASWEDVLLIPTTSDLTRAPTATLPTLGGWTAADVTVFGTTPEMFQAGMRFPSTNSTVEKVSLQIDLPGLNALTELTVFSHNKPLYPAGASSSLLQPRWSFGATTGTRFMGSGINSSAFSGESLALFARNGVVRDLGFTIASYPWDSDEDHVEGTKLTTSGARHWRDGVEIAFNLGSSPVGDYSPLSVGYTANNLFNIGAIFGSGTTRASWYLGDLGFTIVIKNAISDAGMAAISQALAETVIVPEPPLWKVAPGREDAAGGYASTTGKLYQFGGDTNSEGMNEVYEIDRTTGEVDLLPVSMVGGIWLLRTVWNEVDEVFDIYGGLSDSGAHDTVCEFDPVAQTYTELAEALPGTTAAVAVARDPGGLNRNFIFGGYVGGSSATCRNTVWMHDKAAGTVTQVATMPIELAMLFAFAVPGTSYIYFGGGFRSDTSSPRTQSRLFRIHVGTLVIEECPALPYIVDSSPTLYHASTGKAYVLGGYDAAGDPGNYYGSIIEITPNATAASVTSAVSAHTLPEPQDDFWVTDAGGTIWLGGMLPPNLSTNFVALQKFFGTFDPATGVTLKDWS